MSVHFKTGNIHPSVQISPSARVDCDELIIGAGGVIGSMCVIEGRRVEIGRDLWMDDGARIGGGSCYDPGAFLKAGDFLHLGKGAELNTARGITIGDEVGIGIGSGVFTHGAYLDELAGFPADFAPVTIGNRVWLPNAWVNPGVEIGDDVVVSARSLVNKSLPSGCLAGGVPAKVIRVNEYPKTLSDSERAAIIDRIVHEIRALGHAVVAGRDLIRVLNGGYFDLEARTICGPVTAASEATRNQLRRHGIRFRFSPAGPVDSVVDSVYRAWS